MKFILTFLSFLLASFCLFSQNSWQKTIGTAGDEEANWMIPSAPGGFLIGGFSGQANASNQKSLLLKIDSDGNVIWQKSLESTGHSSWFRRIMEAPDGSIFGIGTATETSTGNENALVVKFKSTGQIEWTRSLGGSEREWGFNAIWSKNHLIVAGRTDSYGAGDADLMLFKLKNDGSLVWAKAYGGPGNDWAGDLVESLDGNLIAIANAVSWTLNGWHDILHIKVDQNGNLISSITNRHEFNDGMNCLFRLSDDKLLGAGAVWSDASTTLDGWIFKSDDAGNQIWSKIIKKGTEKVLLYASETADGDLLGSMYYRFPGTESDGNLVKLDQNGNLLFSKSYGGDDQDLIWSALGMPDGGVLAVGMTKSFGAGGADIFLIRTDEKGEIENCCTRDGGVTVFDDNVQKMMVAPSVATVSGFQNQAWLLAGFQAVAMPFCDKIEVVFTLPDTLLCLGECLLPKNENIQPNINYEWIFEGGQPQTSNLPQPDSVCFAAAGDFKITLKASNGECIDEKTLVMHVGGISSSAVDTIKICPNDSVFFEGKWVTAPAVFIDTMAQMGGCLEIKKTIFSLIPDSVSTDSIALCAGDSVFLEGRWVFEPTTFSTIEMLPKGCVLIRKMIVFEQKIGCPVRCRIFWPNIFSPNGDGKNDSWFPAFDCEIKNFDLKIFDRWGELVWQTDDPKSTGWDGAFRSKKMDNAVFAFVAQFDFAETSGGPTRRFLEKGDVTLVR